MNAGGHVKRCKQHQIVRQKQTVDPAAPKSDTLVDSAVTVQTMKRIADSTHPCRQSPTPTVNGCDLTPPTRTQTSEQEYSDLTASNRRPSTLPTAFHEECFLEVDKTCVDVFGILPRFLENLLGSEI